MLILVFQICLNTLLIRYTKALEVLKKLHKDQNQEIKTYKLKLENLQTLKDAAYKLREGIAHDQSRTESLKSQIQEFETSIQDVDAKIHHAEVTLKDLRKLQDQISTKTAERSTLFKEQQKQYAALEEENEDTDEELKEWKTKFEEKVAELESKISKLERELTDQETKKISKLQTEAEVNLSLKNERDSAIRNIFTSHNLGPLPSSPFSNDDALSFTKRIILRLPDLEKDLQDKKKSNEIELKTAWDRYMVANDQWTTADVQRQAKVDLKSGLRKRIEDKENERNSLELQISNVDISHINEREKKHEMERKKNLIAERDFESNITQKQTELYSIEQKIKALTQEKDIMVGDSDERVKLSLKKSELESQKRKHRKMAVTMEFDDLKNKSHEAEQEVKMLQTKIQEDNNNISKLRKDMESRKRYIESKIKALDRQYSTIDSYLKALETAKEKRDVQKSKYNIADGMRQMFDPFERVARAHHVCPCCERSFSAEEEDEFVKKQRVKASTSAEHMKVLAVESSNADSLFQQLDKLRLAYEEYIKMGKETIPNAERELKKHSEELDQKSQALDDLLAVLAQIKSEKDSIDVLVQPIEAADRLFQEIQACQKQVDDLEYKLSFGGQGVKSLEDIQSELNTLQITKDSLHNELEKLRDDQRYMEKDMSNIKDRLHALCAEKVQADNVFRDVRKAEEELERLVEEKSQVELDEKYLKETIGPLSREKDKLLNEYNELKAKLNLEYEEQSKQKMSYAQEVDSIQKVAFKIKEFHDLKKGEKLKELQEKLSFSELELQKCEAKKQHILSELERNRDVIRSRDKLRRNIEDNLNYRKTKAEVDELTREIESLEANVLRVGGISTFESELVKLSRERERLLSELNRCRGTMSVYESNISKNKVDLKHSQYKDIDKRYFDQLIQLKTSEMANKDLDRYYNALDKALMRFHTLKMEEINKIIRELWQQTFLCRPVLASLIIRLALAETFCLNCGILALDEPTTNLDGPNAESLATALLKIMEDRRGQENFQLIVITHDERFAQLIGQRQHAEKYYRVTKDDHQHSIIEAQEIFG
ncbi:hypothetical protein G4B88_004503 [Cannabis sativa]|uniref:Zinc-hook domain-containing protein n=1 Tax=Cannabis sativa TaxID=3483 RepID=A0A7J6EF42_CANSA|nr:hypothetical protein G4B88_004503 [Cannabis sativa]